MIRKAANLLKHCKNIKMAGYFSTHAETPAKLQKVEETTYIN